MAKMRKAGVVTGEKRAADPASVTAAREAEAAAKAAVGSARGKKKDDGAFKDSSSRLFILYGGEASTQIARDLAEKAAAKGHAPCLMAMDDFKQAKLDESPAVAIFVVETIENAQPAEAAGTCLRFYNRKRKSGEKDLFKGKLRYAVLGLGDTNLLLDRQTTTAKDCNQAAQTLDSALRFLGAEQVCARGECNDAVGLEEDFEPWCESLWKPLEEASKAVNAEGSGVGVGGGVEVQFLYGSQTGNATEICKAMAAEAPSHGLRMRCNAMNEVNVKDVLTPGAVVVYVVSSTGDGDAPDNCDSFFTKLKRVAKKEAGAAGLGVQYSVLGLGDQNYSAFMAVPRSFTLAMEKAGACAFYPRGEADETLGLYEYCEKWQDGLWGPLKTAVEKAPALKENPALGAKENQTAVNATAAAAASPSTPPITNSGSESAMTPPAAPADTVLKESDLTGVPALPACRAVATWDATATCVAYPVACTAPKPSSGAAAFTAEEPYLAKVSACDLMTDPKSDRRVLHVEFDVTGCDAGAMSFQPGDSLGVLPVNDPDLVKGVATRLGLDLDAAFTLQWAEGAAPAGSAAPPLPHVRCPATVRDALGHAVDLTSPARKSLLRVLAEACGDPVDRVDLLMLSSRGGKEAYGARIRDECPSLLDLLDSHPSCKPEWATLLDALQPLQPRMYSITTAPEAHPGRPAVAFSVVKYKSPSGAKREGVATNWMDKAISATFSKIGPHRVPVQVPVYVKRSIAFRPPTDLSAPVIMIGPGTGVAPFRGFLERRREQLAAAGGDIAPGPAWMFFGCRKPDEDYLYRADLEGFAADGTLSELICAFSREGPKKVYVQHKLAERAKEVAAMVAAPGAHVFVCGDGAGMAKDVHAALCAALEAHVEGMDAAGAAATLSNMTKEGRYVRDIWS